MGSKLSSPSHQTVDKFHGLDEDGFRPLKRRRIYDDPIGFPLYKPLPRDQQPLVHLSGKRHSDFSLEEIPFEEGALKVDVNKISHKEGPRVKFNGVFTGPNALAPKDISNARARCIITILTHENGEQIPIFLDSQVCSISTFRSPLSSWPEARFDLDSFYVPREKLCIPRDDGQGFALADSYVLRVEFRSAGDQWPPAELVRGEEDGLYDGPSDVNFKSWVLSATIPNIYHHNQNRKPARLKLRKHPQAESLTDFVVDIDARWCSRISQNETAKHEKIEIMPSITVISANEQLQQSPPLMDGHTNGVLNGDVHRTPNGRANGHVNGIHSPLGGHMNGRVNGHYMNGIPASPPEDDEELTPNRSKRVRTEINYNVRQMWNTAVGKEPRKRRKNHQDINGLDGGPGITYLLPMEQIHGDDFKCVLCGAVNHSITQLRAHLDNHPTYLFDFEESRRGSFHIGVSHNPDNPGPPLRPQVYQLGLPTQPFDFEKYVEGDKSWITSRLGPEDGEDVAFVELRAPGKQRPSILAPRPTVAPRRNSQKKSGPRKILIPKTKQALYDPISKAHLEPGSEYRSPVADDTWIIQKHRDTLMDFLDVEPGEKEYMREWDAYILQKHLTTDKFLPRAFLAFVRLKSSWISAQRHRAVEFGKHAAMLLARDAITESTLHDAMTIVNEARTKPVGNPAAPPEEKKTPPRGPDRCGVCDQSVPLGADMLVCSNKKCKHRLYHKGCVPERVERGQKWHCASCR